jgi:hypothetical protein
MRPDRILILILLLLLAAAGLACTDEGGDDEDEDSTITIGLRVDVDDVFGFIEDAEIGLVEFTENEGIVGSRVRARIKFEEFNRFDDKELIGTLVLINPDAIKADEYIVDFTVDEEEEDVEFFIPQINAVPIFLNFKLMLFFEEEDLNGNMDQFEASLVFEYDVNRGRPAT